MAATRATRAPSGKQTSRIAERLAKAKQLNAAPDAPDFRDRLFEPTLTEVPMARPLEEYQRAFVPMLNQGREGSCTGYALASVVHFLLRTRKVPDERDERNVSPKMMYEMARRYDEWPGERYDGSSARGAMKGWYKHGVCSEERWPSSGRAPGKVRRTLTNDIVMDARERPLGAYLRVDHTDLVAMHCALTEVGILYATAGVHAGWDQVGPDGIIPPSGTPLGGHAFALVGYTAQGFWIQNSWGSKWGTAGYALLTYEDWLANGNDVWVGRLGVPMRGNVPGREERTGLLMAATPEGYTFAEMRPHLVSLGNDGQLKPSGTYGTSKADITQIFKQDFPRLTAGWKVPRLLLYAHGGLVGEDNAVQRVAEYRKTLLENEVYPLAFIWRTDYWTTLTNILKDALGRRRAGGALSPASDFMLDRLDDALEVLARPLTGKATWDEMKENALLATKLASGGGSIVAQLIGELAAQNRKLEIHVVGHSAGSILIAHLVRLLTSVGSIRSEPLKHRTGMGLTIASCTLWAPACTMDLFDRTYLPALLGRRINRFSLFTLTDDAERDDNCAGIYHKSLLYMVSNALEETRRIPLIRPDGEPLLGMAKFVKDHGPLQSILKNPSYNWILAPNGKPLGDLRASGAVHHGDFDDDRATVEATLANILAHQKLSATKQASGPIRFARSDSSRRDCRLRLETLTGQVSAR